MAQKMDTVFEAYVNPDIISIEPDDIPKINTTVWILGKSYNSIQELEIIRRDIRSRLWFSYRRGFSPLGEAQYTTDKGWGCMLRCGQMILGQALIDLHLGRDWFWTPETRDPTYLKIVNLFEDCRKSPFSIHNIALMGGSEGTKVGEWFGPNTIVQALRKLVHSDDWSSIIIHVALDNTIVTDEIYSECEGLSSTSWKPLLLVIPLRLGLDKINPIYISSLKKCFEILGNVGMIGGRPNQALYFIGYVEDEAIYLDPHTTQRSGSIENKTSQMEIEFDETFHQKYASRINFQDMDPSLAICFLCKTKLSFEIILDKLKNEVNNSNQILFEITKSRLVPWTKKSDNLNKRLSCSHDGFEEIGDIKSDDSDEGFEFIE